MWGVIPSGFLTVSANDATSNTHSCPCGTKAYQKIYNQHTATERVNNRILNDYGLHSLMIHRKEDYSFLTTMVNIYFAVIPDGDTQHQTYKAVPVQIVGAIMCIMLKEF